MFEPFGTMAPIPEWAGRRAAPPIDLSQSHALFGRKETKEPKNIFICQHLFNIFNPLAIFFPRHRRGFAQTHKEFQNFCSCIFCGQFAIL